MISKIRRLSLMVQVSMFLLLIPSESYSQSGFEIPCVDIYGIAQLHLRNGACTPDVIRIVSESAAEINKEQSADHVLLVEEIINMEEVKIRQCERFDRFAERLSKEAPSFFRQCRFEAILARFHQAIKQKNSLSHAFIYDDAMVKDELNLSRNQQEQLEKLTKLLESKLHREDSQFEEKLKSILHEHYFAIKDTINTNEFEWQQNVFGDPICLDEEFEILGPNGIRTEYYRFFEIEETYLVVLRHCLAKTETLEPSDDGSLINQNTLQILFSDCLPEKMGISKDKQAKLADSLSENGIQIGTSNKYEANRLAELLSNKIEVPIELKSILSEDQIKRLFQIELQLSIGNIWSSGLLSPKIIQGNYLSDESIAKLQELQQESILETQQQFEDYLHRCENILEEAYEEMGPILTDEQEALVNSEFQDKPVLASILSVTYPNIYSIDKENLESGRK